MKAPVAAYESEIKEGHIFFGVTDQNKQGMVTAALECQKAGQTNLATEGTYKVLQKAGFTNIEKTSLDREILIISQITLTEMRLSRLSTQPVRGNAHWKKVQL
jgi:hypothetical protein